MKFLAVADSSGHIDAFVSTGAGYKATISGCNATMDFPSSSAAQPSSIHMSFARRTTSPHIEGLDLAESRTNYLIGIDPSRWRTNIAQYGKVLCRGVYPGIDAIYYGNGRQLEYDLIVAPGADPGRIQLAFAGAKNLKITPEGDLALQTKTQEARLRKPKIYQEFNGQKKDVAGRYVLKGQTGVGFEIAGYDRGRALIIDPVLSYSTYLGGAGDEVAFAVAADSAGNVYVTGFSASLDFPVSTGSAQTAKRGGSSDIFVGKLNPSGTGFIYSTYIGGGGDEEGYGIAVDPFGNAYVTGYTNSSDFPVTTGSVQTKYGGADDAFVLKLNPAGTGLVYATYLGGAAADAAYGIALDASGNAYVAGGTASAKFPVTSASYQNAYKGGTKDAFVSKLNSTGSQLLYSTFLGGSAEDVALGLAVNPSGTAFVTGYTSSFNFPATAGALQTALAGGYDAFVTVVNAQGSALVYSTYLGGANDDSTNAIAIDGSNNAFVAGYTASINFPHGSGVFQPAKGAGEDAFVAKLDPTGSTLPFSTFLGGSGDDYALAIAVDSGGAVYVAGNTTSTDFPKSTDAAQSVSKGGDFTSFLSILNPTGAVLNYSTYFGGGDHETAFGLTLASSGQIFVVGYTSSTDFPVTAGVLQAARGGREDAFIASFSNGTTQPPTADSVTPNSGAGATQSFTFKYSSANGYASLNTVDALINGSSASLNGACYVYYAAASNALYLENDAGTGATGPPLTPGTAGTLQNSQCSIDGPGSSASGSGNTLTLVVAATFKASFAGNQKLFGRASDNGRLSSGWQTLGAWRAVAIVNSPPTADSVTPNAGLGTSQNFTFKYSSVNGYSYLNVAYALINGGLNGSGGCVAYYLAGALYLFNDAGTGAIGPVTPGASGTLQNSQCLIDGPGSSASGSGNTLALTMAVTFKASFSGNQILLGYASDHGNLSSGWQTLGTWRSSGAAKTAPMADSVTPNSGAGATQSFTF
ncbi:MAG: SBBP repeat-containing protein, partial [Acidobacteriota bacterium]|nr:SBBP repeat-containing protein [Acidobacteriota bacterium]